MKFLVAALLLVLPFSVKSSIVYEFNSLPSQNDASPVIESTPLQEIQAACNTAVEPTQTSVPSDTVKGLLRLTIDGRSLTEEAMRRCLDSLTDNLYKLDQVIALSLIQLDAVPETTKRLAEVLPPHLRTLELTVRDETLQQDRFVRDLFERIPYWSPGTIAEVKISGSEIIRHGTVADMIGALNEGLHTVQVLDFSFMRIDNPMAALDTFERALPRTGRQLRVLRVTDRAQHLNDVLVQSLLSAARNLPALNKLDVESNRYKASFDMKPGHDEDEEVPEGKNN